MASGFQGMKAEWKRKGKHGIGKEKEGGNREEREKHEKDKRGEEYFLPSFHPSPTGRRATRTSV